MHDNARPQTERVTSQFLQRNDIETMQWPAMSPDMNPIEHLWCELGRRVRERKDVYNLQQLSGILWEEWKLLPGAGVFKYVMSMRQRVATLRRQRSDHARYETQRIAIWLKSTRLD